MKRKLNRTVPNISTEGGIYTYPEYDYLYPEQEVFARKAIRTRQNATSTPVGFGRIKLWD